MNVLRSRGLSIFTEKINKTALSCFDDKRYVTGFESKAYGHYSIAVSRRNTPECEITDDEISDWDVETSLSMCIEEISPTNEPRTSEVESYEESVYIPAKKRKKNPFIDYDAEDS